MFLTSALGRVNRIALSLSRINPQERTPPYEVFRRMEVKPYIHHHQ